MTPEKAKTIVIVGTGGTVLIGTVSLIARTGELPSATVPLGGFIAGVMLALLAEFAPEVAAAFAAVGLITSIFVYGGDAVLTLRNLTEGTK